MISNIRNDFEQEKEDYYKPARASSCYSNNYIKYDSNSDWNKTLSSKEYLDEIKPYLQDIRNNLKKSDRRNFQLAIALNFISSKDPDQELFESRLKRYQIGLETSMKRSNFIFDCVNLLYYKCHKVNLNCGGPYIDSCDRIKNKNKSYQWW